MTVINNMNNSGNINNIQNNNNSPDRTLIYVKKESDESDYKMRIYRHVPLLGEEALNYIAQGGEYLTPEQHAEFYKIRKEAYKPSSSFLDLL